MIISSTASGQTSFNHAVQERIQMCLQAKKGLTGTLWPTPLMDPYLTLLCSGVVLLGLRLEDMAVLGCPAPWLKTKEINACEPSTSMINTQVHLALCCLHGAVRALCLAGMRAVRPELQPAHILYR